MATTMEASRKQVGSTMWTGSLVPACGDGKEEVVPHNSAPLNSGAFFMKGVVFNLLEEFIIANSDEATYERG